MNTLTIDSVPLLITPTGRTTDYTIRIDDVRGTVHLDPRDRTSSEPPRTRE